MLKDFMKQGLELFTLQRDMLLNNLIQCIGSKG